MIDDIVTRLRGQRTNGVLCEQAADEIERLRTDLGHWREIAWLGYKVVNNKQEPTQFEQAYEKAVNDK